MPLIPTIAFLLARFSEPSSYAGLGALLALVGLNFSDALIGQIAQALAAACGLMALLLKERGLIPVVALALLLGVGLSACTGVGSRLPPFPATGQSACAGEAIAGKLNPNHEAILAEQAVAACAVDNVPATLAVIAAALTAIIDPPAA